MKICFKFSLAIFLITLSFSVKSQIILDNTDFPQINDMQTTRIVDSSMAITLSPGNAGANIIWDFSALVFCCVDNTNSHWTDPVFTASADSFTEAEIAMKTNCHFFHDWITHIVTEICNNNDYFYTDTVGLIYYGSDYPTPHKFSKPRNVFPLVLYGQTRTNIARMELQKSVDSLFVIYVVDTMKADGWGKVITPLSTTDNTIRVYTKETVLDSLYVNGSGTQLNYMPNNYYYKWYTKGLGVPVLQINKGIMETSLDYQIARVFVRKDFEITVPEIKQFDSNSFAYPNPSNDKIRIISNSEIENQVSVLHVYNAQGKQLLQKQRCSLKDFIISKNEIGTGMFFYKVVEKKGTTTVGKFVMN